MNATFLDLITLLYTMFMSSSCSVPFTISPIPIDSLYSVVSCAIIARIHERW